jgi:group I intron endonuclease
MSTNTYQSAVIYIYINLCSPTLKCYVGFTTNFRQRNKKHKSRAAHGVKTHLYNSIRKYGWENFACFILEETDNVEYALHVLEHRYIKLCKSFHTENGYNMTLGGEGSLGCVCSEETKTKRSIALKGKKRKPFTKEWKENISKAKQGTRATNETKLLMSKIHTGKQHSEESKAKMRIIQSRLPGKTWIIKTPNGVVQTSFLKKFCKEHNIKYRSILGAFRKKSKARIPYKILQRLD